MLINKKTVLRWLIAFLAGVNGLTTVAQTDTLSITLKEEILLLDSLIPGIDSLSIQQATDTDSSKTKSLYDVLSFIDSIDNKALRKLLKEQLINRIVRNKTPQDILYSSDPVKSVNYFKPYAGKTIRNIKVVNVDIFSGSVSDTAYIDPKPENQILIPTRKQLIVENLLFDQGEELDPYRLADSERILRQLAFIRDVRLYVRILPDSENKVDVTIVIQDRVPLALDVDYQRMDEFAIGLRHKSLFGTGNELSAGYLYNAEVPNASGYDLQFQSRNIQKSFINTRFYLADNYRRKGYGIGISRRVTSPDVKYSGEIIYQNQTSWEQKYFADTLFYDRSAITNQTFDTWLARSFKVSERDNINISFRYLSNDFQDRPLVENRINEQLHNRNLYLMSLSYSSLNFYKTRNIYGFSITEDVPSGMFISSTVGRDDAEFKERMYGNIQWSIAQYHQLGYTYFSSQAGGFFHDRLEDMTLDLQFQYFTPLLSLGKSFSRWFIKMNYLKGFRLSVPMGFDLTTNDRVRGISGFGTQGDRLLYGSVESVFFLGKQSMGFRFAPYFFSDFGISDDSRIATISNELYYNIGSGMRIRNESLVFNTLDIRLAYFPSYPDGGQAFTVNFTFTSPILFPSFRVTKPIIHGIDLIETSVYR